MGWVENVIVIVSIFVSCFSPNPSSIEGKAGLTLTRLRGCEADEAVRLTRLTRLLLVSSYDWLTGSGKRMPSFRLFRDLFLRSFNTAPHFEARPWTAAVLPLSPHEDRKLRPSGSALPIHLPDLSTSSPHQDSPSDNLCRPIPEKMDREGAHPEDSRSGGGMARQSQRYWRRTDEVNA